MTNELYELSEATQAIAATALHYNALASDGHPHYQDCDLTACDCEEWRANSADETN